jgi:ubiquitin carboxyl-terminal hydrolase 25/28
MDRFLASAEPAKREQSIALVRQLARSRACLHELSKKDVSGLADSPAFLQLFDRRCEISKLITQPMNMPTTFAHAREALIHLNENQPELGLNLPPDFLAALEDGKGRVEEEIERLRTLLPGLKDELDRLWADRKDVEYELVAVFMHRGEFFSTLTRYVC